MLISKLRPLLSLSLLLIAFPQVTPADEFRMDVTWNTTLSNIADKWIKSHSFLQDIGEEVDFEMICQEFLALEPGLEGLECNCTTLGSGHVEYSCTDNSCPLCDDNAPEICGISSYSIQFGVGGASPDYIVSETLLFEYTKGLEGTVAFSFDGCNFSDPFALGCAECSAFVDNDKCTSCSFCGGEGLDISVDCENLASNSSFVCLEEAPVYGIFRGLGFYLCNFGPPENDACSNSTMLSLSQPVMGTTSGATREIISSDCDGSDDGLDAVWYSVLGTGEVMMASTCNWGTLIDTSLKIYSGSKTCDDLLCVNYIEWPCGESYSGGIVSWDSEEGVLYILSVTGKDFDDQFQIITFELPDSANTACNSRIVAEEIDTISSTLDVSTGLEHDICGETGTQGLWYGVRADIDKVFRVSTCSSINSVATTVSIYAGDNCDLLECVASRNEFDIGSSCVDAGTFLDWRAAAGKDYYIYVRGTDENGVFAVNVLPLDVPENDLCVEAMNLSFQFGPVSGNTVNATIDSIEGIRCVEESFSSPNGVFYRVAGTGNFLRATACAESFDSEAVVSVYTGDCSNLTCYTESYYTESCGPGGGRTATWETVEGEVYYIFVTSLLVPGAFELNIEDFQPSPNSKCSGAVGLSPGGENIIGFTNNSIADGVEACLSKAESPGLWYSAVGSDGLTYRADMCSNSTNFDSEISVYKGSCDGGGLQCVTGNDDACGLSSSVQWATENDVVYFIKVHSRFLDAGHFGLTLQSVVTLEHDSCSDAQVVGSGDNVFRATTVGATGGDAPFCGYGSEFDPGIWYKVQGQGKAISMSTCTPQTEVAAALSVYSGSCDELACITEGTSDYSCQDLIAENVTFLGEEGIDYFVLVQSLDGDAGIVGLNVNEFESVSNDFCQNASSIEINSETAGTTVGATGGTPYNECSFGVDSPDTWYTFEGTGEAVLVSTCSGEFDWTLSVFRGNCSTLECIGNGGIQPCTSIRFRSVVGEVYYVLIQGTDASQAGNFLLSVTSTANAAVEGDSCNGATLIDLDINNGAVLGSTSEAVQDLTIDDSCFSISSSGDVWYKVLGPEGGSTVVASTCGPETDFDSQLSVFSSLADDGSCSSLECVTTNDNGCAGETGSRVIWTAEEGKEYFIRVHGFDLSTGNFALTVGKQESTSIENCEAAAVIEVSKTAPFVVIGGSTIDADYGVFPKGSPCFFFDESTEVWYVLPGQNGEMSVSTCSENTNFDTVLEVYQGTCGSLACIDANDDDSTTDVGCSTVTWMGIESIDYHVRVSGFSGQQGLFDLSLSLVADEAVTSRVDDGD